jgi:hypothetical protein
VRTYPSTTGKHRAGSNPAAPIIWQWFASARQHRVAGRWLWAIAFNPQMNPKWNVFRMQVSVKLWCDLGTDIWHADISLTDFRGNDQYGGALVTLMQSKPRQSRSSFLRQVRSKVRDLIRTCWT